jgi:hypothetical protein
MTWDELKYLSVLASFRSKKILVGWAHVKISYMFEVFQQLLNSVPELKQSLLEVHYIETS